MDHTVIIENLKEHKTLLSGIFLFGDLVLDTQSSRDGMSRLGHLRR